MGVKKSSARWLLQSPDVRLAAERLLAHLRLDRLGEGLGELALGQELLPGVMFALRPTDQAEYRLLDAYTRGDDLVARFAQASDPTIQAQVYWRLDPLAADLLLGLSLLISSETSSWESQPSLTVGSEFSVEQVVRLDPARRRFESVSLPHHESTANNSPPDQAESPCLLLRLAGGAYSYCEFAHARDPASVEVSMTAEGTAQTSWRLFEDPLEKGVIRRARLFGGLLTRENEEQLALYCRETLLNRPLPLTV